MSHGIKRVRESPQAREARKKEELSKIARYTQLTDEVLRRKHANDHTPETLELTQQLLTINPEFYTVWNYRRRIFLEGIFPTKSAKDINDILSGDLSLTMAFLRNHPKVYWIWNHRRWCLEHVPDGPEADVSCWRRAYWAKELHVVEKILDADSRNFHAWNYRRYILASSGIQSSPSQELAYTARKIESNFSNFSAWHQRSKVFSVVWGGVSEEERRRMKDEEFDLIKQAMYTDPGDQSVWLYHRWLIGSGDDHALLEREIQGIEELRDLEPDSKWCLDALVHYKTLLLQYENSKEIISECLGMLSRLQELDPFRKERYMELTNQWSGSIA